MGYIHHQGGGWCESVSDCAGRANGGLGSTKGDKPTITNNNGYFSRDAKNNPLMHNWNMVYLRYCDGGSFSGDNATTTEYSGKTLYFRGHRVLHAMMDDLLNNQGLSKATDVVISGCS